MRVGQSKFDHEVGSQMQWMEGVFKKSGIGKMTRRGFKIEDQRKADLLFDILDTDPILEPQRLARKLTDADKPMREAASELRSHMNWLAHRQGVQGDQFISGYIHHVFDKSWLKAGGHRPPEMMGLGRNTEIMANHLLDRKGNLGYKRNPVEAMELMVRGATRKLIIQPMLEDMTRMGAIVGGRTDLYTRMLTDTLKGKPGFMRNMANTVTHGMADKVDSKLASISGAFYVGILTGNAKYIMENWATAITTTTARYGMGRTLKGLMRMATKEGRDIAKSARVDKIWDTMLETPEARAMLKELQDLPVAGLHRMEFDIRGMTFWTALENTMNDLGFKTFKELEESGFANRAMFDAVRRTESINHFYGVAGRSPVFNQISPGPGASQTAMQFLSFGPKQVEELVSQYMENPGFIMRYMAMSGIMTRIAAQQFGVDTSENVGMGFIEPSAEALKRGGGPGIQALKSMAQVFQAFDDHDWIKMQEAAATFAQTAQRAVPLATMMFNMSGAASELHNKEKISPRTGEKVRDLNLKKGDPFNERFATALQLPSVQDRLQKQFDEAATKNVSRPMFEMREALKEYKRTLAGGDSDKLTEAIERLADLGIPFDPTMGVASRDMLLRNVDRNIRTLLEDPEVHGGNFDLILDNPYMYGN